MEYAWIYVLLAAAPLAVLLLHFWKKCRRLAAQQTEFRRQGDVVMDMINLVGMNINANLDLTGTLETITEFIANTTRSEAGAIFLLDTEGQYLTAYTVSGPFPPIHTSGVPLPSNGKELLEKMRQDKIEIGEGVVGFVAKTGEPLLISNAMDDPRVPRTPADYVQIQTMMAAPLRTRQRIIGVFAVLNKKQGAKFNEQDLYLLEQLSIQAALTVDIVRLYQFQASQRRIEQELQIAKEFQQMLLPRQLPHTDGFEVAAFSKPALEVGGDYYDVFWVEPGARLGMTIVDVAGKGIRGALVMAIFRSLLKAESANSDSPRSVLTRINARILEDTQNKVFVTALYAILDIRTLVMRVSRAGHEPLLICREDEQEIRVCQPGGIAIGLVDNQMFGVLEECEIQLKPGDSVVMYTDGVTEATDVDGTVYGMERFNEALRKHMNLPAEEQINEILEEISSFTAGTPQQDDITMVALKLLATERKISSGIGH